MSWTEKEGGTNWQGASMNLWYGLLEHLGYEVYYYDYAGYNAEDFYKQCEEIKVDYVIQAAYSTIHTEFVKLRKFAKVFLIHADINYRYDIWTRFHVPFIDGLITFDEGDGANDAKQKAVRDGMLEKYFVKMPWGFNPHTMVYTPYNYSQKDIPLSFVGHLHANRPQRMAEFSNLGFPIYRPEWELTGYEDAKKTWARSKFTICFTWNAPMTKRVIPARILEMTPHCIMACEPCPGMERYFEKDKEYIEMDDAKTSIDRMKSMPEKEYIEIFNNCRRKIWREMTSLHQWNKVLSQIDEDYKQKSDDEIKQILKANYGDYYFE